MLCAKPKKTTLDGYYDDFIRTSFESRIQKYTKIEDKTSKTKYNKQKSKQATHEQVKEMRAKKIGSKNYL